MYNDIFLQPLFSIDLFPRSFYLDFRISFYNLLFLYIHELWKNMVVLPV